MLKGLVRIKNNLLDEHRALQIFNLGRFGCTLLVSIILVKLGMREDGSLDVFELFLFYSNIFIFFWVAGYQKAFLILYPKLEKKGSKSLLFNLFMIICLAAFLSVILLSIAGYIGFEMESIQIQKKSVWYILLGYTFLNIPSNFVQLLFLLKKQSLKIIHYTWINFGLQFLAVVLPLLCGFSFYYSFICLLILAGMRFLYASILFLQQSEFRLKKSLWLSISAIALPISLHTLIGNSVEYIDGFIVEYFYSDKNLFAVYKYGAKELPFISLMAASLVTSCLPILSVNFDRGTSEIKTRTKRLAHLFFPLSIILLFSSKFLFTSVYDENFLLSAQIFNIYLLIICTRLLLPQALIMAKEKSSILIYSALISTLLNIGLSLFLLNQIGILGIAYASLIANLANKLILIIYVYFQFDLGPSKYINVPWHLSYCTLLLVAYLISYQQF